MDEYPPSPLNVSAMESVCGDTKHGWLWYCDEHDTHGNGDSKDEVDHMAEAHVDFFRDGDDDACTVITWFRTPHERSGD